MRTFPIMFTCLLSSALGGRWWTRLALLPRGGSNFPVVENVFMANSTASAKNTTSLASLPLWKQKLPERLQRKGPKTLRNIQLGNVDIYLLGTAHVSNDSSADVDLLLRSLNPDCIMVELCDARAPLMEGTDDGDNDEKKHQTSFWEKVRAAQETQGASRLQALSSVLLTSVQEDYAEELGVELGGEFRCAHKYWLSRTADRPHLVLGDRPLSLTLIRAWESLWWWPKTKVFAGLLWSSLRKPNKEEIRKWLKSVMEEESDVLTESFQELRKHFPTLYTTIIEERDAWLAVKLVQTCRALYRPTRLGQQMPQKKLVAIVGAGHVPGICQWLTNSTSSETPEQILQRLVSTRKWAKDELVQNELIPSWVQTVTELNDVAADIPPAS